MPKSKPEPKRSTFVWNEESGKVANVAMITDYGTVHLASIERHPDAPDTEWDRFLDFLITYR